MMFELWCMRFEVARIETYLTLYDVDLNLPICWVKYFWFFYGLWRFVRSDVIITGCVSIWVLRPRGVVPDFESFARLPSTTTPNWPPFTSGG